MDRLLVPPVLAGFLVLALGCPGDDGTAEDGPEPTTSSSATGTTGTATDPSATGPTASGSASGTTTDPSGDSTGAGVACGDATCGAGEYCDWSADGCGEAPSEMGTCMPRPEGCGDIYQPVCGCDGQVYGNDCDAQAVGVDVAADGACETPEGYFRCGFRYCEPTYEYCQISTSDIGGFGDGYACVQPAACDPLSCDCLTMEPCFDFGCNATMDGGIEIVCPGG